MSVSVSTCEELQQCGNTDRQQSRAAEFPPGLDILRARGECEAIYYLDHNLLFNNYNR